MKKRILLTFVLVLFVVFLGAVATLFVLQSSYIRWNGQWIERDVETLDLTYDPITPEQYEEISALLPTCDIHWLIPLGSESYHNDTEEIILKDLKPEDIPLFQYFTALKSVDARKIHDYETILQLKQALPDCRIHWQILLGNAGLDPEAEEFVLTSTEVTARELKEKLSLFPNLNNVVLTDVLLSQKEREEIVSCYPNVRFEWCIEVGGLVFKSTDTILSFQNADISAQTLLAAADQFYQVQKLDLRGCALTLEELLQIRQVYQCDVLAEVSFYDLSFCTDVLELDLSNIPLESTESVERLLPLMMNLERVRMCNCGISSEDMDALGKRYPQIRFVWNVQIGKAVIPTDTTAFIPCDYGYWPTGGVSPWSDAENRLFDEDCYEFRYCVDMICLDLGHMGLTDLSFLECMPNLKYLILADNPCKDFTALRHLQNLVHLELFMTKFDQADVLTELKQLETLNLGYTRPTNWEPLMKLTWLEMLWLPGTKLDRDSYRAITQALPDTKVDYTGEHSTDHGWRNSDNYREMRDLLGMPYME